MEGKNKFNTYVVSFDYPSSYSSVFLRLRSLMYDMNFLDWPHESPDNQYHLNK